MTAQSATLHSFCTLMETARTEENCTLIKKPHIHYTGACTRTCESSLGRYVFGSEISYNKPPPRLPGLGC